MHNRLVFFATTLALTAWGNICLFAAPVPPRVSGFKTPTGFRIVSREPDDQFTLDLAGAEIKPMSSERLLGSIDGKQVELFAVPRLWDPPISDAGLKALQDYKEWDLNSHEESSLLSLK
jgi:hypothetical protein